MDLVTKQREERKQRILEVARRLVADRGYDGVTMRELAEESLVSVPTLYNLFGGKNELLMAAVESYFIQMLRNSTTPGENPPAQEQEEEGLPRLIALAELLARQTMARPAYARSLLSFLGGPADVRALHDFVARELNQAVLQSLETMQRRKQLAEWVDIRVAAERITAQMAIATFEWASGHLSDEGLPASMLYSIGVMLLGLARGKTAQTLEALVRANQTAAATPDGASEQRAAGS